MTKEQYILKQGELSRLRKSYKHHVIFADSATKINHIRELISKLEEEIRSFENKI